jgi:hypothetical protein
MAATAFPRVTVEFNRESFSVNKYNANMIWAIKNAKSALGDHLFLPSRFSSGKRKCDHGLLITGPMGKS